VPIIFNRVVRNFRLTVNSDNEDKILEAAAYLDSLGFNVDIEETLPGVIKEPARPRPPSESKHHWMYAFWRKDLLGYIGKTSRRDERIKEHIKTAAFGKWLFDGQESGDLSIEIREGFTFKEAKALEARVIRENNPLFNVQHNRGVDLALESGDRLRGLLGI
jgi:hypothetical protein